MISPHFVCPCLFLAWTILPLAYINSLHLIPRVPIPPLPQSLAIWDGHNPERSEGLLLYYYYYYYNSVPVSYGYVCSQSFYLLLHLFDSDMTHHPSRLLFVYVVRLDPPFYHVSTPSPRLDHKVPSKLAFSLYPWISDTPIHLFHSPTIHFPYIASYSLNAFCHHPGVFRCQERVP
jgi:hypothetical protein